MSYILTARGINFDLLAPKPEMFDIEDIAHALSNLCRFTGHVNRFYSVAQHSVMCSYRVPEHEALDALMHDAHEAYVGDCAAPLKRLLPDYRDIEDNIERVMREAFKLSPVKSGRVHYADMVMLANEKLHLMPGDKNLWPCLDGYEPDISVRTDFVCWDSNQSYIMFLARFKSLVIARGY